MLIPEWKDLLWFRPHDSRTPPYLVVVRTASGFFADASENHFSGGTLSTDAADLRFSVGGISGLKGHTLIFGSWYLEDGAVFGADGLKLIQSVEVAFQ